MAKAPFRVTSKGPGTKGTTDGSKASPWPGSAIVQAQRTGGPLPDPQQLQGEATHGHSPRIPWPQDGESAGKRPFKNTK